MSSKKNIIKIGTILIAVTFISKMTGFFRELLLGIKFGASFIADSYVIAMTIPSIIFTSLIVAAMTCFIPIYSEIKIKEGEQEAIKFTNNALNIIILISLVFISIVLLFTDSIIGIVANGFEGKTLTLAIELLQITAISMLFSGISQIGMGFLQAKESFIVPTANNILANILVIIAFLFSNKIGIKGIAIVSVVGAFTQIIIQYPYMIKNGYKYKLYLNFKDKYINKLARLFIPILMSTAVLEINLLVDRMLASQLIEGSISALNYANKINMFVFGILSVSISTIAFPKLSECNAENKKREFENLSNSIINIITVTTVPILTFIIFFNKDIVRALFSYGRFDEYAVNMTSTALLFYSIGMIFMGYRDALNKIYYSMHNTKTPMINSIIATIFNIVLSIILVRSMKHNGVALASSIALIITTVLLVKNLKRVMLGLNIRLILLTIMKSTLAATSILIIHKVWLNIINQDLNNIIILILLSITFIVYLTIYIGICYIIKEQNIYSLIRNNILDKFSIKSK